MPQLSSLPVELKLDIFAHLTHCPDSFFNLVSTSRGFFDIYEHNKAYLLRLLFKESAGEFTGLTFSLYNTEASLKEYATNVEYYSKAREPMPAHPSVDLITSLIYTHGDVMLLAQNFFAYISTLKAYRKRVTIREVIFTVFYRRLNARGRSKKGPENTSMVEFKKDMFGPSGISIARLSDLSMRMTSWLEECLRENVYDPKSNEGDWYSIKLMQFSAFGTVGELARLVDARNKDQGWKRFMEILQERKGRKVVPPMPANPVYMTGVVMGSQDGRESEGYATCVPGIGIAIPQDDEDVEDDLNIPSISNINSISSTINVPGAANPSNINPPSASTVDTSISAAMSPVLPPTHNAFVPPIPVGRGGWPDSYWIPTTYPYSCQHGSSHAVGGYHGWGTDNIAPYSYGGQSYEHPYSGEIPPARQTLSLMPWYFGRHPYPASTQSATFPLHTVSYSSQPSASAGQSSYHDASPNFMPHQPCPQPQFTTRQPNRCPYAPGSQAHMFSSLTAAYGYYPPLSSRNTNVMPSHAPTADVSIPPHGGPVAYSMGARRSEGLPHGLQQDGPVPYGVYNFN